MNENIEKLLGTALAALLPAPLTWDLMLLPLAGLDPATATETLSTILSLFLFSIKCILTGSMADGWFTACRSTRGHSENIEKKYYFPSNRGNVMAVNVFIAFTGSILWEQWKLLLFRVSYFVYKSCILNIKGQLLIVFAIQKLLSHIYVTEHFCWNSEQGTWDSLKIEFKVEVTFISEAFWQCSLKWMLIFVPVLKFVKLFKPQTASLTNNSWIQGYVPHRDK